MEKLTTSSGCNLRRVDMEGEKRFISRHCYSQVAASTAMFLKGGSLAKKRSKGAGGCRYRPMG